MKIVMLKTASAMGRQLPAGSSHDLPDGEAEALVRQGSAAPALATREGKAQAKDKAADAG